MSNCDIVRKKNTPITLSFPAKKDFLKSHKSQLDVRTFEAVVENLYKNDHSFRLARQWASRRELCVEIKLKLDLFHKTINKVHTFIHSIKQHKDTSKR